MAFPVLLHMLFVWSNKSVFVPCGNKFVHKICIVSLDVTCDDYDQPEPAKGNGWKHTQTFTKVYRRVDEILLFQLNEGSDSTSLPKPHFFYFSHCTSCTRTWKECPWRRWCHKSLAENMWKLRAIEVSQWCLCLVDGGLCFLLGSIKIC